MIIFADRPLEGVYQRKGFAPEALRQALVPVIRCHINDQIAAVSY